MKRIATIAAIALIAGNYVHHKTVGALIGHYDNSRFDRWEQRYNDALKRQELPESGNLRPSKEVTDLRRELDEVIMYGQERRELLRAKRDADGKALLYGYFSRGF